TPYAFNIRPCAAGCAKPRPRSGRLGGADRARAERTARQLADRTRRASWGFRLALSGNEVPRMLIPDGSTASRAAASGRSQRAADGGRAPEPLQTSPPLNHRRPAVSIL